MPYTQMFVHMRAEAHLCIFAYEIMHVCVSKYLYAMACLYADLELTSNCSWLDSVLCFLVSCY